MRTQPQVNGRTATVDVVDHTVNQCEAKTVPYAGGDFHITVVETGLHPLTASGMQYPKTGSGIHSAFVLQGGWHSAWV
jgi:hypothetical protein